jgi:hypothetical protein
MTTSEEFIIIMEAARAALNDANIFDELAERLDISDSFLSHLQLQIQVFLDQAD